MTREILRRGPTRRHGKSIPARSEGAERTVEDRATVIARAGDRTGCARYAHCLDMAARANRRRVCPPECAEYVGLDKKPIDGVARDV